MTVGYGPQTRLCTCGKAVTGNGAKASHRKACPDGRYYSSHDAYEMRAYAYEMSLTAAESVDVGRFCGFCGTLKMTHRLPCEADYSGSRDGSDV